MPVAPVVATPAPAVVAPAALSLVYAIGNIGFDFGTEARRDTFRQLMPQPRFGSPPTIMAANPYDAQQLSAYLDANPWDSTKVIWTLNLELTPIYAIEAELAYAEDVYRRLRDALAAQTLPADDPEFVSRVSIPGVLTSRTVRLFSGQVVPVVVAQRRGLHIWNEQELVGAVVRAVQPAGAAAERVSLKVRQMLDKVYYQLRNLGQSPPDRALNFQATNAFVFASAIADGLLSGRLVDGDDTNLYTLDRITAVKSPYCRVDSDCWDVQMTFFDPENDNRARVVFQSTIDVSDELPVQLAPTHQFLFAT
jgi:cyanobactin maturation PatA/PatG family protease